MLRKKKGQSSLEYIVIFSAIVVAILVLAYTKIKPAVSTLLDSAAAKITTAAGTFK